MVNTESLFTLIHSLSKSEKRYFRLQAPLHEKTATAYLRLFDAIEGSNTYRKDKIRKSIQHNTKHFSFTQHHLFNQVIKSLGSFHAHSGIDSQMRVTLNSLEPLFKKHHYKECVALLRKIKLKAQRYERFVIWQEAIEWELRLAEAGGFTLDAKDLQALYKEQEAVARKYQLENACRQICFDFMHQYYRELVVRTKKQEAFFRSTLKNALFNRKDIPLAGRIYLYKAAACIHCVLGDSEQALENNSALIALLEANPHRLAERYPDYIAFLSNQAEFEILFGQFSAAARTAKKMFTLAPPSARDARQAQLYAHTIQLYLQINTGQFTIAAKSEKQVELLAAQFKLPPIKELFLFFLLAHAHFGAGNYARCGYWLDRIFSSRDMLANTSLADYSYLLNLVLRYESGDADLFESAMRSTQRSLHKRNALHPFEKIFLAQLRRNKGEGLTTEAFRSLKKEVLRLNNPGEQQVLGYFDLASWVESKIQGKNFAEIMREKANA